MSLPFYYAKAWKQALQSENDEAFYIRHEYGEGGMTKDPYQAFQDYKKAAEQGNSYAACLLGTCYQRSYLTAPKNIAKAIEYYEQAGKKGNAYGWYQCARIYLD